MRSKLSMSSNSLSEVRLETGHDWSMIKVKLNLSPLAFSQISLQIFGESFLKSNLLWNTFKHIGKAQSFEPKKKKWNRIRATTEGEFYRLSQLLKYLHRRVYTKMRKICKTHAKNKTLCDIKHSGSLKSHVEWKKVLSGWIQLVSFLEEELDIISWLWGGHCFEYFSLLA